MIFKKLLAMAISLTFVLSMAACTGNNTTATTTTTAKDGTSLAASNGTEGTEVESSKDTTTSGDPVTLTFGWWGGDGRHTATLAAIDAFMEKYPNITIKAEYGAWSGWEEAMATKMYAGTAPDINQINWNWIQSFSPDGTKFLDLNTVSDTIDLSQFPEDILKSCSVEETNLQTIPVAMTGRAFFWNKTTYEKAGLEIPENLVDLMAAGPIFKEKLGDDFYPLAMSEYDRMIMIVFYLQSVYDREWVTGDVFNYTEAELAEGLDFIQSLEDAHVIPSIKTITGDGADSFDKNPKWIEGNYAGMFEWDSASIKNRDALAEGQEMVVGDYFTDMGKHQGGFHKVSLGLSINANTKHPKEAAMLIDFLLNDPEGAEIMGSERGIPLSAAGLKVVESLDLLDPMVLAANTKVMEWTKFSIDPFFEAAKLKALNEGVYFDALSGLSYGDYDSAEAAKILFDAINEVIAEG